jgi:hypothetical protein
MDKTAACGFQTRNRAWTVGQSKPKMEIPAYAAIQDSPVGWMECTIAHRRTLAGANLC